MNKKKESINIAKIDLTKKKEKEQGVPLTWDEMDENWEKLEKFTDEVGNALSQFQDGGDSIYISSKPEIDQTEEIQNAIDEAYRDKKPIVLGSGEFLVTRSIYLYDGLQISGQGIYNTILRTPFTKKAKYYTTGTPEYEKAMVAESYVSRDACPYYTATGGDGSELRIDLINGHNRFYIGDGSVGYYDHDRDINPDHPLYYPRPTDEEELEAWKKWKADRDKIEATGRFIGPTGRENYGEGVFKSSQIPGLRHTWDKNSDEYSPVRGTSPMHTGVRDITIRDLCIATNSVDRGKDSGINFGYKASYLKGMYKFNYDSSCLKIHMENVWIRDCGGCGYTVTRAVQHTFVNCSCWRIAEIGWYIDGVTSVHFQSCYANSCAQVGYNLVGCNYVSMNSCAADGCGTAYNIRGSHAISLNGCGGEATRYTLIATPDADDEPVERYQKGRTFSIRNSSDVGLYNCYSFAFRNRLDPSMDQDDIDGTMITEESNPSRHVYVVDSIGVVTDNCYWKSALRIRTTPFRNAAGDKCNINMGPYDDTTYGSRVWQVQNFLMGASYDVKGASRVSIRSNKSNTELQEDNEIRCNNCDILDPGTVPNPAGYDTAGKTLTDRDGNGGWTRLINDQPVNITWQEFELLFPLNNSKNGNRDDFWQWRYSLKLIKVNDDETTGYKGYKSVLGTGTINWDNVTDEQFAEFTCDLLSDRSNSDKLDGDPKWFSYGRYMVDNIDIESTDSYSFVTAPQVNGIPGYSKQYTFGSRTVINALDTQANSRWNDNTSTRRATLTIISNDVHPDHGIYDKILQLIYPVNRATLPPNTVGFGLYDANYYLLGGLKGDIDENKHILTFGPVDGLTSMLSRDHNVRTSISHLDPQLEHDIKQLSNKINQIIYCLEGHNLCIPTQDTELAYNVNLQLLSDNDSTIDLQVDYECNDTVYMVGVAYSSTNENPSFSNNHKDADSVTSPVQISINKSSGNGRYIRAYIETSTDRGESNRHYSDVLYVAP